MPWNTWELRIYFSLCCRLHIRWATDEVEKRIVTTFANKHYLSDVRNLAFGFLSHNSPLFFGSFCFSFTGFHYHIRDFPFIATRELSTNVFDASCVVRLKRRKNNLGLRSFVFILLCSL